MAETIKHSRYGNIETFDEAIAYIEACRDTHVEWAAWQRGNPNWIRDVIDDPESAGSPEFHTETAEEYERVLNLMRGRRGTP